MRRAAQLAPTTLYLLVFFGVPLAILLGLSVFRAEGFDIIPAFTTENYAAVFTDPLYREVTVNTVIVGLVTAALTLLIAWPLAYIATFVFPRHRETLFFLILLSLFGGYLVRVYAWRTILGEEGIINQTLLAIGLIDAPLKFLLNSRFAVVLTLANFLVPLAVLPIFSSMQNLRPELLEAGHDLGAGRWRVLRTVTLPLTLPGLRTGFAFAFVLSAGDYVTPAMVGGTSGLMTGNVVASQFTLAMNWPFGAALAFVLVGVIVAVYAIVAATMRLAVR
jgi:spermidine/putrescine transport system permease protein